MRTRSRNRLTLLNPQVLERDLLLIVGKPSQQMIASEGVDYICRTWPLEIQSEENQEPTLSFQIIQSLAQDETGKPRVLAMRGETSFDEKILYEILSAEKSTGVLSNDEFPQEFRLDFQMKAADLIEYTLMATQSGDLSHESFVKWSEIV